MKYHKISNINLEVCTAEQMIAYNIAFDLHINYGDVYEEQKNKCMEFEIANFSEKLVNEGIKGYKSAYDYTPGKYNIDAIFCCLNAGLRKYLDGNHFILASYDDVGKAFPATYLPTGK